MTNDEVRREISPAIVECEVDNGRGDPRPAIRDVTTAKEVRKMLCSTL